MSVLGPRSLGRLTPTVCIFSITIACWTGSGLATEVQYCGSGGVPRKTLQNWDEQVQLWSRQELEQSEATHLPWGFPACTRRLFTPYYIDCYDSARRAPVWVAYRLSAADVRAGDRKEAAARAKAKREGKQYRRPESFRTDPRLLPHETATCDDYKKQSELAGRSAHVQRRGHSAPDADFRNVDRARGYTYYLSNMTPQWQLFNGGIWGVLEGYVRDWAKKHGSVHVFSGAIFDSDERMRPTKRVTVPTSYFKIVVREVNGKPEAITFILPNWKNGNPPGPKKKPDELLTDHVNSVRMVREQTGIDFFPDMAEARKQRFEAEAASELWLRD